MPQGRVLALSSPCHPAMDTFSYQSDTQGPPRPHKITSTPSFNGISTTWPRIPTAPWATISMPRRTDNLPHQITANTRYALLPFPSPSCALAATRQLPQTASLSALTAVAVRYCPSPVMVIQCCRPQHPSPTSIERSINQTVTALFQPYENPDDDLGNDGDLPLLRDPSIRSQESLRELGQHNTFLVKRK